MYDCFSSLRLFLYAILLMIYLYAILLMIALTGSQI
jgi:hypothetical protein